MEKHMSQKNHLYLPMMLSFIFVINACGSDDNPAPDQDLVPAPNNTSWYKDADTDGFGDPNTEVIGDQPDNTYVTDNTDCDDTSIDINPNAIEAGTADLIDSNCDGDVDPGFKYIFVTSTLHTGDITTSAPITTTDPLIAADAICQNLANNATIPLPGTYAAWLSTSSVDALNRVTDDAGNTFKYVLADPGTLVSDGFAGIIDSEINNEINVDESGVIDLAKPSEVWTGTGENGQHNSLNNCLDWTSAGSAEDGFYGENVAADNDGGRWTQRSFGFCDVERPFYCFQK